MLNKKQASQFILKIFELAGLFVSLGVPLNKIRRVEMHMMPYYSDERGMVEEDKEERKKYGRAGVFCVRDVRY